MNKNSKIFKYVENRLDEKSKIDFEKLIENDNDLKLEVQTLKDLYNNGKLISPSLTFKQNIYSKLNLSDNLIDILIKKTKSFYNVINGKNYMLEVIPHFVTRSSQNSILFHKKLKTHSIYFEIYKHKNNNYINFKVLNDKEKSSNVKFDINSKIEKFTTINGETGSFRINDGIHIIDISQGNLDIGTIKLNIS